ncbi:MAG: aminotransferase class IV [Clostridiales bacterium]|nr:aminotransferase class IV [Clostridiales bacterium]
MTVVYLNGSFVPYEKAMVPVEDRGFLFADGIYEVIRVYGGKPFALQDHMLRLARSAELMELPFATSPAHLKEKALEALEQSGLKEATIYIQVTRGFAGPRVHDWPKDPQPTELILVRAYESAPKESITLASVPDQRWELCHIKSIGLYLNTRARMEARRRGKDDGLFVRDGIVTEASSSNFFAVHRGTLYTHPEDHRILPGITRRYVIRLAQDLGIPVKEEPFTYEWVLNADEAFITGTTSEVTPAVGLDHQPIGGGQPGPITLRLKEAYRELVRG